MNPERPNQNSIQKKLWEVASNADLDSHLKSQHKAWEIDKYM